jgi:hypothetical protein
LQQTKFEKRIEMRGLDLFEPQVLRFSAAPKTPSAPKAHLITKDGEQVFEIWLNGGGAYARATEQDLDHEGFRKLDLRICATGDALNKFDNPKHFA